MTETVEVTGAPPLLQTDRADTGAQLEVVHTASLPLGTQRNYQSLLNLVPGTTRASFQHSQFFNAASSLQTEVNGQMRMGNSYQVEGMDNNERTGLLQIIVPPLEAIQAVDVSTSNYEASLGRASGANTNVILKSGTNEFHGAGYEFLRNSAFNARNFFDASVGHLAYNYFGGNIGGPIKKNKIFIFGDFLRVTDHEANTNLGTIPPSSWRTGNLSSGLTLAAPVVVYDPATGNPDGTNRTPFAGNIIPTNRISPIAAKILSLVPAPNQASSESAPSNNYFALLPYTKDTNSFDVKVDDAASDKGRLSGRFSYGRPVTYQAPIFGLAGGFAQGAFQGTSIQKTYSMGVNYNRIFSPTLISEFRVGVAHYHNDALPDRLRNHSFQGHRHSGREHRLVDQRSGEHQYQRRLQHPAGRLRQQPAVEPRGSQHQRGEHLDQDDGQPHHQVGRGLSPPARRPPADADHQPARPVQFRYRADVAQSRSGRHAAQDRTGEQHGQLPAGSAVRRRTRYRGLLPGPARSPVLRLRAGQVAGILQADPRFRSALGVLSAAHATFPGGFLQLQPGEQHTGAGRRRRQPHEYGHAEELEILCAAPRHQLPPEQCHGDPRRVTASATRRSRTTPTRTISR